MGSGRMPRTEESRKWRSTSTQNTSPQIRGGVGGGGGLMVQLAAVAPKRVCDGGLKTHRVAKICFYVFHSTVSFRPITGG